MSLLPPSSSPQERAAETVMGGYEDNRHVPIAALWRPGDCPPGLLPWLAWALAVVRWDPDWDVLIRRRVAADAMPLHRIEGTRAAVERMLADLGVEHAPIVENPGGRRFTASLSILNSASLPGLSVAGVQSYIEDVGRLSVEWAISLAVGVQPMRLGVRIQTVMSTTVAGVRLVVNVS